jgi:hypothetical protein
MSVRTDGVSTYLTSPVAAVYSSLAKSTICMWVKCLSSIAALETILIKDQIVGSPWCFVEPTNAIGADVDDDSQTAYQVDSANNTITQGIWFHYATSYDMVAGGKIQLYLNGVNLNALSNTIPPGSTPYDDSASGFSIGNGAGFPFNGELSDVRIYNAVLSPSQIASVAAGGTPASANLTAWWKFCSGNLLADSSGNGNTLTNFGAVAGATQPPIDVCIAPPPSLPYSVPDCRVAPFGPNANRIVQGTKIYDVQTSDNAAIPPVDSRTSKPVDSRVAANIPENSRTPGIYGPGE